MRLKLGWIVGCGAALVLAGACGDDAVGSGSASAGSSTTQVSTTTTTNTTNTSTTTASSASATTISETGSASDSASGTTTTGSQSTSTGVQATTTSSTDPTSSTGAPTTSTGAPTTSTGDPTTGDATTSTSTGDGGLPPQPPALPNGCDVCDCCDPWPISWGPSEGATHYEVRWKCSINPEQVHNVGDVTMISDVCDDIDMCNGMCAFTVGYINVAACNENGCSAPVEIPAQGTPISCGGGCCC